MNKVIWILGIITGIVIVAATWYIVSDLMNNVVKESEESPGKTAVETQKT